MKDFEKVGLYITIFVLFISLMFSLSVLCFGGYLYYFVETDKSLGFLFAFGIVVFMASIVSSIIFGETLMKGNTKHDRVNERYNTES